MAGREGPGSPGKGPESPGKPRKPRRAPEGPGRPGKGPEGPGRPRKTREGPEAPGRPGSPGRPGGPRKASEGPGGPRKAPESPGRAPEGPGLQKTLPGNRRGPAGLSVRKEAGLRGQAPGLPVHGLRRAGVPSLSDPAASGLRTGGGCGLAPVQGRLSASLKQVPGCLKGRCPATWVHERAEIAPNRAQRQRPAASGRSRGDCPQVQGQNTAARRFFWSVNVTLCVFSTRTDCRRPFSGAGAGRASGGVVPTVPAAA